MSTRKQHKAIQIFYQWQLSKANPKSQMQWLLRSLLISGRQPSVSMSGFVLPTVAMVSMVVALLTTALLIRSFDRSRYASNLRVDEAVLNAATPALDRAGAKLDALLADPRLLQEAPTDTDLYNALTSNTYALGDETRLKLVDDTNRNGTIEAENNETLTTAWRFPVDTDNNGRFDSYTLYGIYFRSPISSAATRNPLEARTSPIERRLLGRECERAADIRSVNNGWYKSGAKLNKSFFVYTATVGITNPPTGNTNYEAYRGNRGFSALEVQQERSRIPLSNNVALFQDDLEISPNFDDSRFDSNNSTFRLNGSISTNGNLLISGQNNDAIRLFQVSSKNSCFYTEDNSKITVGGNVAFGSITDKRDRTGATIDLFNGFGNNPILAAIDRRNKSTNTEGGTQIGYNDAAYSQRIALMKQTALSYHPNYLTLRDTDTIDDDINDHLQPTVESVAAILQYPPEVKEGFAEQINTPRGRSLNAWNVLAEQIEIYHKNRTRRVPYAEVPERNDDPLYPYTPLDGIDRRLFAPATIEPPTAWRQPIDANNIDANNNLTDTAVRLNLNSLPQTQPEQQQKAGKETYLGDRIYLGNNLPPFWKNEEGNYVTGPNQKQLVGAGINWTDSEEPRDRSTQVIPLPDAKVAERNGFWEDAAAQQPATNLSNVGGLRVITGAGIYVDDDNSPTVGNPIYLRKDNSFLRPPLPNPGINPRIFKTRITRDNENIFVWPDSMSMAGGDTDLNDNKKIDATEKGDLLMRATAVYHYKDDSYKETADYINRTPTACVSSYYDPTNENTARNEDRLPDVSGIVSGREPNTTEGRSNNGVVYDPPYTSDDGRESALNRYRTVLDRQARLVFHNGRIVNQTLRDALKKIDNDEPRSLVDNSALDTAICAISILENPNDYNRNHVIPHGAIKEASFLDARQVKDIHKTTTTTDYDLELEQRQPLEVRVTDIDLGLLATALIDDNVRQEDEEYLMPTSGIIYATRDDALLDLSSTSELLSPTDFRLDPTRRPNGIRLINGRSLARSRENDFSRNDFREEEKGLIFATNLPAYIKGDFNLHQPPGTNRFADPIEEFLEELLPNWSNFYERFQLDNRFACRRGEPGCSGDGDLWRPATIISDAIAVLSNSFVDGFRALGDYDLRNNVGSSVAQFRDRNGFSDNNFVTSADWAGNNSNGFPSNKNSYLTNGVTPIQRRTYFPEYVMEMCRKLPVSECGPNDWVLGLDLNGDGDLEDTVSNIIEKTVKVNELASTLGLIGGNSIANDTEVQWSTPFGPPRKSLLERIGAGTTARPALDLEDRRYARRIAFGRNSDGTLETDRIGNNSTVKPLGVGCSLSGCEYPGIANPTAGNQNYGTPTNNTLWFRTTNNQNGEPGASVDITYASNAPLYHVPPELGGEKLFFPDTPDIPDVPSLNLPEGNQSASDYAVCLTNSGVSQEEQTDRAYLSRPPGNRNCPPDTVNAITNFFTGISNLSSPSPRGELRNTGGTLIAQQTLNVYEIPTNISSFEPTAKITLDAGGNPNAIFVLKATNNLTFKTKPSGRPQPSPSPTNEAQPSPSPTDEAQPSDAPTNSSGGVQLELINGVDPNNVFWVINGSLDIQNGTSGLKGNFIGRNGAVTIGDNIQITGRILGFGARTTSPIGNGALITATTSKGQPSLVPVLQIHSPEGAPTFSREVDTRGEIQDEWLQVAEDDTTVNAIFVAGNSPSRPVEESAGLQNFIRLLENWDRKTLNIKGSFIQFKRSAYATAPFATISSNTATARATDSPNDNLSLFDYPFNNYRTDNGEPNGTLPYFKAPNRQWSFDVGLLYQFPDLFAQQFNQQSVDPADEFYREVSRDDPWIETLLCAAEASPSVEEQEVTYTQYAIPDKTQRPSQCQSDTANYPADPVIEPHTTLSRVIPTSSASARISSGLTSPP